MYLWPSLVIFSVLLALMTYTAALTSGVEAERRALTVQERRMS